MRDGLTIFPAEQLESFTRRVLLHFGTSEEDAASAAKLLILGDLRGIDSHGIVDFVRDLRVALVFCLDVSTDSAVEQDVDRGFEDYLDQPVGVEFGFLDVETRAQLGRNCDRLGAA